MAVRSRNAGEQLCALGARFRVTCGRFAVYLLGRAALDPAPTKQAQFMYESGSG